mmetsp:Transcript_13168/g.29019  ORF Transcript_13168/g.29019 Transcript_13168/m.29019 type:complete len:530 (+) Transcript_13168:71-1660(+)
MRVWHALLLCWVWPDAPVSRALGIAIIQAPPAPASGEFLEVTYSPAMQPLVNVSVGGQMLKLVFDASSGDTAVLVKEMGACMPQDLVPCYSWQLAQSRGKFHICKNPAECIKGQRTKYQCSAYVDSLENATSHTERLLIDGLNYELKCVEGKDDVQLVLSNPDGSVTTWPPRPINSPIRLVEKNITAPSREVRSPSLFQGTNGILGASGPSLSCRNETLWHLLLEALQVTSFALDFQPPPQAVIPGLESAKSRIVLNSIERPLLWSQPKQTGDIFSDGMHEFLIYHPQVCGVDLLYNISSNWLVVIDTSGPCLTLPSFLFDRVVTHIPVTCPFHIGENSLGRLCTPRRDSGANVSLPSLLFQLEDDQEPGPPRLHLPLERLVFRSGEEELLCLSRSDDDSLAGLADMTSSHISLGSMAVSAFYMAVSLANHSVGLAPRGQAGEASSAYCAAPVTCPSPMQTPYPPLNICEDPECSEYLFTTLDEVTKMCVWNSAVPISFGLLLAALAALDLISHRLYKQAIERASESCQ